MSGPTASSSSNLCGEYSSFTLTVCISLIFISGKLMRDSGMILQLLSQPTLPPSRHHQSSTRITTFSSLMDTLRSSRVRTIPSSFGTKRSHVLPGPNIAPERAICRKRAPWRNRGWNLVLRSTHTGSMRTVPFSDATTMGRRIALCKSLVISTMLQRTRKFWKLRRMRRSRLVMDSRTAI